MISGEQFVMTYSTELKPMWFVLCSILHEEQCVQLVMHGLGKDEVAILYCSTIKLTS